MLYTDVCYTVSMCGIIGYVGTRSADSILLEGLHTLEYRGYDSSGLYIPAHGAIHAVGPIASLVAAMPSVIHGNSGIAHTRWATHGAPTRANAHPHRDFSESVWIVHNGIIDNWREIKEGLQQQGITFTSETDTEVLAKLIGMHYRGDMQNTLQTVLPMVRGTYGIAVMHEDHPDQIFTARLGSPIILGISPHGNLVASDPSALLAHTKDVVYLDDGDIAVVTADSYDIISQHTSRSNPKATERIDWDVEQVKKNGFEHFMLKEIYEAPDVIKNTIRGRLIPTKGRVKLGGLESVLPQLTKLQHLTIVGCGSAYYAGVTMSYALETYGRIPAHCDIASEYRYRHHLPDPTSAVIAISQSGETADTLAAVTQAREQDLLSLGIINVVGSTIPRTTHAGVYNHAGPEVAVASTKAFLSQLTVGALMTLLIGRERGVSHAEGEQIISELDTLPDLIREMLSDTTAIQNAAHWIASYNNALFLGRHAHAPIAAEGALKLKEVSYIHAEAYPGGELKHGPLALLDEAMPVVAVAPEDHVYNKLCSNLEEVRARSAPILAITTHNAPGMKEIADHYIEIPKVHPLLQPIISTVPLHLLAYYVGVARGLNVDRPRNLAKSVTVE